MNKPITANTLKIIKAKKNKDSSFVSIENYASIIDNVYSLIFNTICNVNSDHTEISRLFAKYCNLTDSEKDQKESMLKKINEVQNNLLDILWNTVDNKIKRDMERKFEQIGKKILINISKN